MISFRQKGNFSKTYSFLKKADKVFESGFLEAYAQKGVKALAAATPKDTGKTSESWTYEIRRKKGKITITFYNSNIQNGVPIAIILQYGHATKNGGWVEGRDYINPAIQPIFDEIAEKAWKEVTDL